MALCLHPPCLGSYLTWSVGQLDSGQLVPSLIFAKKWLQLLQPWTLCNAAQCPAGRCNCPANRFKKKTRNSFPGSIWKANPSISKNNYKRKWRKMQHTVRINWDGKYSIIYNISTACFPIKFKQIESSFLYQRIFLPHNRMAIQYMLSLLEYQKRKWL